MLRNKWFWIVVGLTALVAGVAGRFWLFEVDQRSREAQSAFGPSGPPEIGDWQRGGGTVSGVCPGIKVCRDLWLVVRYGDLDWTIGRVVQLADATGAPYWRQDDYRYEIKADRVLLNRLEGLAGALGSDGFSPDYGRWLSEELAAASGDHCLTPVSVSVVARREPAAPRWGNWGWVSLGMGGAIFFLIAVVVSSLLRDDENDSVGESVDVRVRLGQTARR